MVWTQGLVCFIGWLAFGWWLRLRSNRLKMLVTNQSRKARTLLASVGIIASGLFLIAGLALVTALGGMTRNGLTGLGWIGVFVVGLVFIAGQVVSAGAMVSLFRPEVTSESHQPSEPVEKTLS